MGIQVLKGDNIQGMAWLKRDVGAKFALVYADPPFYTQRDHFIGDELAFADTWPSRRVYLEQLQRRLEEARDLLDDRGSLVLHLNSRISHAAKLAGDEVFREEAFVSEIVWRYRRWPTQTPNFQRVHDVLLRWVKDPKAEPRWNQLYEPLAESTRRTWGKGKQSAVFDDSGKKRLRSRASDTEESKGVPMGDVWDIGIIAPSSRERTGYTCRCRKERCEREERDGSRARDTSRLESEGRGSLHASSSGRDITDRSPQDSKSTTRTKTSSTTGSKTSSLSIPSPTSEFIPGASSGMGFGGNHAENVGSSSLSIATTGTSFKDERDQLSLDVSPVTSEGLSSERGFCRKCGGARGTYPTQKPKALLRRLIEAVTNPGDLVLDPYAGSGTTLEVAQELGRNAYGIDSSEVACKVMAKRLNLEWVTI